MVEEYVKLMDSFMPNRRKYYEPLGKNTQTLVLSFEQLPKMEQKSLPRHLRYAYLRDVSTLPVIISASLTVAEEDKLLRVVRDHKDALGWSLADLKGIRRYWIHRSAPFKLLSSCIDFILCRIGAFDLLHHFYVCASCSMSHTHFSSGLVPEDNF